MELQKCEKLAKLYNQKKRYEEILEIISSNHSLGIVSHWRNGDFQVQKSAIDIEELIPTLDGLFDELVSRVKRIITDLEGEMTKV